MTIAPADAAVAARSFPRRWRELFTTASQGPAGGDVLDQPGSSSPSARALAARARDALAGAAARLGGAMAPAGGEILDSLAAASDDLATRLEATAAEMWHRDPGALDLLSRAVDEASAALREAERVLEEVSGTD